MKRTVDDLLAEALVHFNAATGYADTQETSRQLVVDAIAMRLFAGLEALTRLPDDVTDRLFPGTWPDMRGLRHRIAHGYAVSLTRVRETVTGELPSVITTIRYELDHSTAAPSTGAIPPEPGRSER